MNAMRDELTGQEKLAVTLRQLHGAAGRIAHRVPGAGEEFAQAMGGLTLPTTRHLKSPVARDLEAWQAKMFGTEAIQGMEEAMTPLMQQNKPGTIFVTPGVGRMLDPNASRSRMQGLRDITVVHEGAERAAPLAMGSLHANPEVLAKDFNIASRLEGPGSRGVRRSFEQLREPEFAKLKEQLSGQFGERASEFMQPGAKIPKAMRKRIRGGLSLSSEEAGGIMERQSDRMMDKMRNRPSGAPIVSLNKQSSVDPVMYRSMRDELTGIIPSTSITSRIAGIQPAAL